MIQCQLGGDVKAYNLKDWLPSSIGLVRMAWVHRLKLKGKHKMVLSSQAFDPAIVAGCDFQKEYRVVNAALMLNEHGSNGYFFHPTAVIQPKILTMWGEGTVEVQMVFRYILGSQIYGLV